MNIGTRRSHEKETIHITTTWLLAVSKAIKLSESADVTSVFFFSFFFFLDKICFIVEVSTFFITASLYNNVFFLPYAICVEL